MKLDIIDRKLLNLLQAEFPLAAKPYDALGRRLGIGQDEVTSRIARLKVKGLIRQIGPVFDAASLGYKTTLVAMRVAKTKLDRAAQLITEHPGVSHAYERDHYFNLWLTLAAPATADMEAELEKLATATAAETAFSLPALRLFKLRVYFSLDGDGEPATDAETPGGITPQQAQLSTVERQIINELQQDLPLIPQPFAEMASRLGMDEETFLARCQELLSRGVMRRFGAALNHRRAGFAANAMTCWIAPPEKVASAGRKLASLREVSHCYERKTNPLWRYNLFAMAHGKTKEECREAMAKVSAEMGLDDYVMLFSTRELKKTRLRYLV
ncbi:MAG TPA: Lrp/AsnC family transcriptional regulator [Dehalococcoidia bacterium]|jgi:DNA-binding Lrp family transcriptional regulator|nr:Lrp/AsnC family transcriptional regulator [Dehalococcoidia bacterium]